MSVDFNDGGRPSRLELGRQLTGELSPDDGPDLVGYAREIEAARSTVPAFDLELLSARAARLDEDLRPSPRRARRWWETLMAAAAPALVVATALLALRAPVDGVRTKGGADLDFYVLHEDQVRPGVPGERLSAGDRVQFTYRADGAGSLVLVGVDGEGTVNVYYPDRGDRPEPVQPDGRRVLEGSIELDGARGPEVFVAIFGTDSVNEALELVEDAYDEEGWPGLRRLALTDPAVDWVRVEKGAP